jgi:beta,beta-carotene 9',10'-dioxygenase
MAAVTQQAANGRDRGFLSGAREIDDAALAVRGSLPPWLQGRLLLNGPALWELPGGALDHWFDGYAMRHRLHIAAGAVRYRSRFARSDAYTRSRAAGRPVYGEFGSANPASLWTRLRQVQATDNPAVVISPHGGRWMSVTETPHLSYFDPDTLESQERLDLSRPGEPLHLMSAHGFTLADGSYLNVGAELGPRCTLKLFRVAPGATQAEVIARQAVARPGYLHGFALAPRHALVWDCAWRVHPLRLRFSASSYEGCFDWQPAGGAWVYAMPLAGGEVRRWQLPAMFVFHAVQAWEDGDTLVLEACVYDDPSIVADLRLAARRAGAPLRGVPRLVRCRLRPGEAQARPELVADGVELPQAPAARAGQARARVCWASRMGVAAGEFADATLRVDLDRSSVQAWQRPGARHLEPLFVPRPGAGDEDDGVLFVPTLADADAAGVIAVLDARDLRLLAEIDAPQVLPFGFHAAFVPVV